MKLRLKKDFFYPFLLLFFPIIIDCINGYLKGPKGEGESLLGMLYRGVIVFFSCFYLFRNTFSKYILSILIVLILSQIYQIMAGYFYFSEISSLIKVLYIFCVLSILLGNKYCSNIRVVANCAIGYGIVAALVLIYCFVFKIGYNSYVENTFGTKGFFVAMNDVGLTIILLNALSCFFYLKTNEFKFLLAILIMSMGACLVGSMACYGGTAVVLSGFVFNIVFGKFKY